MADTQKTPEQPKTENPAQGSASAKQKKIDRIAERSATRAEKTEKKYDEQHNIFTE